MSSKEMMRFAMDEKLKRVKVAITELMSCYDLQISALYDRLSRVTEQRNAYKARMEALEARVAEDELEAVEGEIDGKGRR